SANTATLAVFALAAVAPGLLAPGSPEALDLGATLQAPSAAHWFGTDELGRDLYTRVVHGTGLSLLIGLGAAAVSLTLAVLLAAASALTGRILSGAADRTIEILFAFPTLLLALLLIATLGPSPLSLVLAVGVGTAPGYARIVRGQLLSARTSGYVEAATALGHGRLRIVAAHILPNALRPLVGIFTMSIGQSIVWASSLAFLGLGVAPPSPEWGALLDAGRAYLTAAGWLVVIPGHVIAVLALATTTLGKHIQTRLETGR
uniref:ABC transporter permease n=1 Tax=uncultured Brevibacterium sp. TaxID=189678 RepID=UPI0025F79BCB